MVQHHIQEVTELGRDAGVMHIDEDRGQNLGACFRALVRVDLIQQSHDFFAQAERSGVAGRGRALRQTDQAEEEAHESAESLQPHDGKQRCSDRFNRCDKQRRSE